MPLSPIELQSLLVLNRLLLGGAKAVHHWLWEGHAPSQILNRIRSENFLQKAEALQTLQLSFSAEREIEKAEKAGVRFLTILDSDYPVLLKHITDPPLVLYIKGSFCETDRAAVAMVGTRHPSLYGLRQAKSFANGLAERGVTVVSGLAQGIDQASHKAALEISYGRTIAVLGCGLDQDYPAGSRKLRDAILERGAVISEYAFGGPPCAENFPRRNRIIAGLSRGVLVVEAHARSGSLITARLATEEGREVFAVPGQIDQLTARGTNHLIKEGAALVEHAGEILEILAASISLPLESRPALPLEFNFTKPLETPLASGETSAEEQDLMKLMDGEGLQGEEIMTRSSLQPHKVFSLLTKLELQRKIQKSHDGRFCAVTACG
jgi:DNA processing protein